MVVIERPYSYNWSKNDIRYVFNLNAGDIANQSAQIKILYADAFGSTYTELITLTDLLPDASRNVYVYIQGYLNSILGYDVPLMADTFTNAASQAKKFYVHYREISDAHPNPDWIETEIDNECTVIKGGIEKMKHSRNNFFINYFDVQKPFATWLPANRFVYAGQPVFLSFLNTQGGSIDFTMHFSFTDVLANAYTLSRSFSDNAILWHLNVSPGQSDFPAFTANLYYYEVWITNSAGDELTTRYRIYIEYRPCYEYWDMGYHNSLGGFDTTRVMGETTITIDKNYEEQGAGKDLSDWNSYMRGGNLRHGVLFKRNNYKGDVGYQKNAEENEALQELLITESAWQSNSDYWMRVLNVQKGQDLRTSKSRIFSFPIQWQLAVEDEVFTPMNKNFGIGTVPTLSILLAVDDNYTFSSGHLEDSVEDAANPLANDHSDAGNMRVYGVSPNPNLNIETSAGGNLSITEFGDFIYTHPSEDYVGGDSCEYTITDDSGQTSTAIIYITVT
jgi:hypothetical protein